MKTKDVVANFELLNKVRIGFIKCEPNKTKRFWKLLGHYLSYPFVWIWYNIRDWRTLLIFFIVCAVISVEVWLPYLLGVISWRTDFSKWCFGIGSTLWLWWLLPGTPFLPLCIGITIGIKAIFNKIKNKTKK